MPRYAVSHIDQNDNDLTTEIVEAVDMFEAIKKSPKACGQVSHVFDDPEHSFYTLTTDTLKLEVLKNEAFNTDGMINVVLVPDPAPEQPDTSAPLYPRNTLL